ncbi:PAS domain S-box-containing protein [Methanomicrobium sp. W14]|uniref:PAS domain-containing protein n=1 Tax=Methanomicrobium sp. W14 TaxID=2817839 RepID=UPI001AE9D614|nr:PAS domain-containing protein [Methanomicrobium sp. W14]MBP2132628.1 PAS domain S-box-containing protein [Methanomicrobium sp. W14]
MEKTYSSVDFCSEFISLINTIPDAVVLFDNSGSMVVWNKAAEQILGYSMDEITGRNFTEIISLCLGKDKALKMSERFESFVSEETGLKNSFFKKGKLKRKDGTKITVEVSVSSVLINNKWYAVSIARDVSDQMKAEYENAYLSNVVKSSNEAFIGLDLNGDIISWNDSAERILGYMSSEIIGRNLSVIIPEEKLDEISGEINRMEDSCHTGGFETGMLAKSGKIVTVIMNVSPVRDNSCSVIGTSIIATDISREKEMFKTMINYISEAAMRLKTPAEMVRMNLLNIIDHVKNDTISKENLVLNLSIQMKSTEQIVHNLRELNQAIIGSYEEIPEEYVTYFNK